MTIAEAVAEIDIDEAKIKDPVVSALLDRIKILEHTIETSHEMSFEEMFAQDLRLTEVGKENGRSREKIALGHSKTYDMLMDRVGDQINAELHRNGFTKAMFTALIRAYYSKEGRAARR